MYEQDGKIVGIGPTVASLTFKELNAPINCSYAGPWDEVQGKAKSGNLAVIVALYKTPQREKYLDYSIAYATDPGTLFFRHDKEFTYAGKESLIGKRILCMPGDSYGTDIDGFLMDGQRRGDLTVMMATGPKEAFDLLANNTADCFIYSYWAGRKFIKDNQLKGFENSSTVYTEAFYMGISKKSCWTDRMDEINPALQKVIGSGIIARLEAEANDKIAQMY